MKSKIDAGSANRDIDSANALADSFFVHYLFHYPVLIRAFWLTVFFDIVSQYLLRLNVVR